MFNTVDKFTRAQYDLETILSQKRIFIIENDEINAI